MKIYLVGGAVRDKKLGLPVKEQDFVVVGAQPGDLLKLGYKKVGKEFPVFLHPKTNEDYALARMERKVAPGYAGFAFDTSPNVTLEEDLLRRDLTINAMAETPEGQLVDPYHGAADLDKKLLRHVSPAFTEDPVRILRIARFAARFSDLGFKVAPETNVLMQEMVRNGEVDALVPERVWKELERALGEKSPQVFFQVLADCGALEKLFPMIKLDSLGMKALQQSVKLTQDTVVRFACLIYANPKEQILELCNHNRLPVDYKELAVLVSQYYQQALEFGSLTPEKMLDLYSRADAFRREERFKKFLLTCQVIADTQGKSLPRERIVEILQAVRVIDEKEWEGLQGKDIADKIYSLRLAAIARH